MSKTRIKLSAGSLPSPQLERLATSHPFIQQIDVVFPSSVQDHAVFTSLKTTYSTARFTLSELYDLSIPTDHFKALPTQCSGDDTWCIDPRGILTLSVSKGLYEKLGLVGQKLPFKGCPERYVIRVPLQRETVSVAVQARQRAALRVWDGIREAEGLGRWEVAYVGVDAQQPTLAPPEAYAVKDVTAHTRHEADLYVPRVDSLDRSPTEDAEDYEERLAAFFEWVGMACLGAQRLRANDRVDPYVAVYEAPSPASIGDIVHLRWRGLMDGSFVRSVVETAVSFLSTLVPRGNINNSFISITMHSNLGAPVAFLPESREKEAALRLPGSEAEDTICLGLSKTSDTSTWAIAESVGKCDARWG